MSLKGFYKAGMAVPRLHETFPPKVIGNSRVRPTQRKSRHVCPLDHAVHYFMKLVTIPFVVERILHLSDKRNPWHRSVIFMKILMAKNMACCPAKGLILIIPLMV